MSNLSERLKLIKSTPRLRGVAQKNTCKIETSPRIEGFSQIAHNTFYRKKNICLKAKRKICVSQSLAFIVPDLRKCTARVLLSDIVFFDLETTGLSGGSGTVAFLAAFGKFCTGNENSVNCETLQVEQYLLTDHSGEINFLTSILPYFKDKIIVTYNGKSFDSQILRTRCIMNGLCEPVFLQADLLHPVRRLWKYKLSNCSQSEIERQILCIKRTNDIPGSRAPDIWFDFLKTNQTDDLIGICDHNVYDIAGLAEIFCMLNEITEDPLINGKKYFCNMETLAIQWRQHVPDSFFAEKLLMNAAEQSNPVFLHANKILAMHAEWVLKDYQRALAHVQKSLTKENISQKVKDELLHRKLRLEKKLAICKPQKETL
ncbi:MAG: ribonuclease H-like domain-containing protein [Spirochaetaceae bacterium]|jgi:uncharacterized protein YprB with RNaseH-like and TPR domain|nr:ribonuclease H-like domain-containing protein [Spirochaetaceae bacterium]